MEGLVRFSIGVYSNLGPHAYLQSYNAVSSSLGPVSHVHCHGIESTLGVPSQCAEILTSFVEQSGRQNIFHHHGPSDPSNPSPTASIGPHLAVVSSTQPVRVSSI